MFVICVGVFIFLTKMSSYYLEPAFLSFNNTGCYFKSLKIILQQYLEQLHDILLHNHTTIHLTNHFFKRDVGHYELSLSLMRPHWMTDCPCAFSVLAQLCLQYKLVEVELLGRKSICFLNNCHTYCQIISKIEQIYIPAVYQSVPLPIPWSAVVIIKSQFLTQRIESPVMGVSGRPIKRYMVAQEAFLSNHTPDYNVPCI